MNYLKRKITARFVVFLTVIMIVFWSVPCNFAFGETQEGSELPETPGSEQSETNEETAEAAVETTDEVATEEATEETASEETEEVTIETTTEVVTEETATDTTDAEATLLPDTTPPVITLIGGSPVMVELGSTYTDAGATAADDVDGDLTGFIEVLNTVDTAVPGSYKVTYNVSDAAGNAAAEVTRIVNVVGDLIPPVITLIGGSPVMVELGSTYTDAGATAADDVDGDLTGFIEVLNTVDTAVPGSYKVTYNVSDAAGNAAAEVTRIVNVAGKPAVATDKDDYSPGEIVVVTGSGWLPGEIVKLDFAILPLQLTLTYYATADGEGNIFNNEYIIFEHHLGQTIILTATGQTTGLSAVTIFTDSPKIGSVTVGNQSPNTVYPPANARYTITIRRGSGSGSSGAFTANLSMLTVLPSGCTASFNPAVVSFTAGNTSRTSTLTITTTSGSTPIGSTSFTVKAEVSGTPADFATGSGTLRVGGVGSVTAGSQSPNPVYASNSTTYTVTVNRGGGTGPFSADLSITTSLPSGCTYSFSPSTVSFLSGENSKTSTLTVSTSSSTPAGSTSFTIRGTNSSNPNDYKNRSRTLRVETDITTPKVALTAYLPDPTVDNTPTYSGSATDTRTNIVDIEYRVDSDSWTDVDTFTPAKNVNFTFTTPALSDGLHTIYARAYDAAGNVSAAASDALTVGSAPAITEQPSSATKTIGESVTFSVTASGTAPLSYQWRKNGANISGATSSSYTIPSVVSSDAGSYDVVVSNVYGSTTSNTATLTVNPIVTNLSVSPASGIYGGTIDLSATITPAVSGKTISFTLNGSSVGSAVTNGSGVATLNGVNLSGINAGSYPGGVGASFVGDSNYSASSGSNSLTINPAPLTITADNTSRIYGDPNPAFSVIYSGFVAGDDEADLTGTLEITTTATESSPVGTYPITPSGLSSGNYNITFVDGILTVDAAPLTVTADDTLKVYGDSNPAFSVTYSGFAAGDNETDLNGSLSITTTATEESPVGTYPITPSALSSDNYNITFVDGTLTITPAPLTITAGDASRVYGSHNPSFSVTYSGFAAGDDESDLNGSLSITTAAEDTSPVGTYPITPSGLSSDNYNIAFVDGTLTVTAAPLTVIANNASRVYGNANPLFSGTITGIVNSDNIMATYDSPALNNSPAGTYPIIPILSDPDGKLGNYAVTIINGILTITAAAATVTTGDDSNGKLEDNIIAVKDEMLNITIAQLSTATVEDPVENLFDYAVAINDEMLITASALILDNEAEPNITVAGITSAGTKEVSEFTRLSPIILISGIGVMAVGLIALFIYLSRMMRFRKLTLFWLKMIR